MVPDRREQVAIVEFVDQSAAVLDDVIGRAQREIELLWEFLTRLTADVVTGQLDVREIAARLPDLDPTDLVSYDVPQDDGDPDAEAAEHLEAADA